MVGVGVVVAVVVAVVVGVAVGVVVVVVVVVAVVVVTPGDLLAPLVTVPVHPRQVRIDAREARRSEKRKIRNGRIKKASLIGGSVLLSHLAYYHLSMGGYISAALAFCRAMFLLP